MGEGSKIPIANIEMPVGEGQIVTDQELARHINERNPRGTRASDVGVASEQTLATHLAEDASLTKKGHTQLSNATNSVDETKSATPKAVKTTMDEVNKKYVKPITGIPKSDLSNAVQSLLDDSLDSTDFTSTLTENGYQKLPGGLIIQWGFSTPVISSVTFPIVFPNQKLTVIVDTNTNNGAGLDTFNNAGFTLKSGGSLRYIAVGY